MRRARILLVVPVAILAMAALTTASPAAGRTARESAGALRKQIDAGKVKAATVYTKRHIVHASLTDKRRFSATFKPAAQRGLVAAMRAHHVRFHIVASAKPKSHGLRRRYIALIAVGAIVLLGLLGYAVTRRRRKR